MRKNKTAVIMRMFYIVYHGKPNELYQGKPIGGAYIGCWIMNRTMIKAEHIARKIVTSQGWDIIEVDEKSEITPESVDKQSERFEYYQQALIDKEVVVYYTYPKIKKSKRAKNSGAGS